ncbi:Uncharacterised protein [uncultured archaeon]|nr:Uncharacterised protein [uncultured archaeon]
MEIVVKEFEEKMKKWENYKIIRSRIEDVFNISKNCLDTAILHQYTLLSVKMKVAINLFLAKKLIALCVKENI